MKHRPILPVLVAVAAVAGCGSDESRNLTAAEERALDNAASMLDDDVVDVSPDSLTANVEEFEAVEETAEAPVANAAANAQ